MAALPSHMRWTLIAMLLAATLLIAACSLGAGRAQKSTARPFVDGETLGVSTTANAATADQVHTLLSVTCEKSSLIIRTSVESIVATSDCTKAPLEAELDRALGLPATISRIGDTLRITNPSGIKIEVQATNIMLSESHVSP